MKDLQYYYVFGLSILLILAAIVLGFWLIIRVMIHGGIMQAVTNWGIDNSAVVWGIVRVLFWEIGLIPPYFLLCLARKLLAWR